LLQQPNLLGNDALGPMPFRALSQTLGKPHEERKPVKSKSGLTA